MTKRIAILQTGKNNAALRGDQPDPPELFRQLLSTDDKDQALHFDTYSVIDSVFPDSPADHDGYVVTGSPFGVYEDEPWIIKLLEFIRAVVAAEIPIVGICFGHQAIAKALGGEVVKAPEGWGLGIRSVAMTPAGQELPDSSACLNLIYVHQDQVIRLPKGAVRLAGDDFCPNAAYKISDKVLAFQGHPEFTHDYVSQLYDVLTPRVGEEKAAEARTSMSIPDDSDQVGKWIVSFLNK